MSYGGRKGRAGRFLSPGEKVVLADIKSPGTLRHICGKGTFLWDGAAGVWFWVDPTHDIVFVGMVQTFGTMPGDLVRQMVYQALLRPEL